MKFFGTEITFNGFDIWHKGNFDPDEKASKDIATITSDGLMSSTDKIALDGLNNKKRLATYINDFYGGQVNGMNYYPLASGTMGSASGDANHQGIALLASASTATSNSGYMLKLGGSASLMINGGEELTVVFQTPSDFSDTEIKIGFYDGTTATESANAIELRISSGVLSFKTIKSSTATSEIPSYTLSPSTWYTLKIRINTNASSVTYILTNNATGATTTVTHTINIPKGVNIGIGFGTWAVASAASRTLLLVDFIRFACARDINR